MAISLSADKRMEQPVLVFLHYFGGSSQSWKWVAQLLSEDYHCILIDLPGFGNEPALADPSISGFAVHVANQLKSLSIDQYVLIGHSMGGKIAVQLAADQQSTGFVTQLILIAPSPPSIERKPVADQQRMLIHPDPGQAETTVKNSTLKMLSEEQHLLAVSTQMIADELTWRWWINEGINHSIADLGKSLRIPVTLIASKDDPAVTYEMITQDALPNLPPHTRLIVTEDIGHLFPMEDAEWTAGQIVGIVG